MSQDRLDHRPLEFGGDHRPLVDGHQAPCAGGSFHCASLVTRGERLACRLLRTCASG